jgi:hypothetical protein
LHSADTIHCCPVACRARVPPSACWPWHVVADHWAHRIWQVEVRELASTALAAMLRLHDEAVLLGLHGEFSEWARTKVCVCVGSFEWMMRVHGLGRCTRARLSRHAHR